MRDIASNERYSEILKIQEELNHKLRKDFEREKIHGREHLARFLTERVGALVDDLNSSGYSFGPCVSVRENHLKSDGVAIKLSV